MRVDFIELKTDDVIWDFDLGPKYAVRGVDWPTDIKIDPFPCAQHDMALVRSAVQHVASCFPVGCNVRFVTMPHEFVSRTNGFTEQKYSYRAEGNLPLEDKVEQTVALSGKRTMILPQMTRYLVAHEYGHVVDNWIDLAMSGGKGEFEKLYAETRGVPRNKGYGGGRWAGNIGEVIADDFRILVAGVEADFWPHPVPHPHMTQMHAFWARMRDEHGARHG